MNPYPFGKKTLKKRKAGEEFPSPPPGQEKH